MRGLAFLSGIAIACLVLFPGCRCEPEAIGPASVSASLGVVGADGTLVVAGQVGPHFLIFALSPDGTVLWRDTVRAYDCVWLPKTARPDGLQLLEDGTVWTAAYQSIYFLFFSLRPELRKEYLHLLRYTTSGSLLESAKRDVPDLRIPVVRDQNSILLVESYSGPLREYTSDGKTLLWQSEAGLGSIVAVRLKDDRIFAITASPGSPEAEENTLLEFDEQRALVTNAVFSFGERLNSDYDLALGDTGLYVLGTDYSESEGGTYRMKVLKLSLQGVILWQLQLPAEANESHRAMALAQNGDLIVLGPVSMHRLSGEGELLWSQRYEDSGRISVNSAVVRDNDNFSLLGAIATPGEDSDILIVNINGAGEETSRYVYDSTDLGL